MHRRAIAPPPARLDIGNKMGWAVNLDGEAAPRPREQDVYDAAAVADHLLRLHEANIDSVAPASIVSSRKLQNAPTGIDQLCKARVRLLSGMP